VTAWLDRIAAKVAARRVAISDRPFVIGLAGGVASGKSHLSGKLAERLRDDGLVVRIVSLDGFLMPNAALADRGLMERKGWPESYDWTALADFMLDVVANKPFLSVPEYWHHLYDVDGVAEFPRPEILILEGLIALDPRVAPVDLSLFIEAGENDLIEWYIVRFMELERWKAPRLGDRLAEVGGDPHDLARDIWRRVNSPLLHGYILPTRAHADFVLEKARDHSVRLAAG
jgi:type I pantothenate kinase